MGKVNIVDKDNIKLNMGCGADIKEGYINIDIVKGDGVDMVLDLNKTPYPFETSSIYEIYADSILEHLPNILDVLNEWYRITKPEGRIIIKVPYYASFVAFGDMTHCNFFNWHSFDNFTVTDRYTTTMGYKMKFDIVSKKIRFFANKVTDIAVCLSLYLSQ